MRSLKRLSSLVLAVLLLAQTSSLSLPQATTPARPRIKSIYPIFHKDTAVRPDRDRLLIASRSARTITVQAEVTGYDLCYECTEKYPSDPNFGIGAASIPVTPYRTVALPQEFPFDTEVKIADPDLQRYIFVAEDRGGAIVRLDSRTIKIDVLMNSHEEAQRFGKRYVQAIMILPK